MSRDGRTNGIARGNLLPRHLTTQLVVVPLPEALRRPGLAMFCGPAGGFSADCASGFSNAPLSTNRPEQFGRAGTEPRRGDRPQAGISTEGASGPFGPTQRRGRFSGRASGSVTGAR